MLDEIYDDDAQKIDHLREALTWRKEHPLDADVQFMLGVFWHFDGEQDRAQAAFLRTVELTGIGDHALAFLPPPPEEEEE